MMDKRFNRQSSRESTGSATLQKKLVDSRRPNKPENAPDLTDFMNDMFFGSANTEKKAYNLTGNGLDVDDEEEGFDDSTRSNSSRLTQEWLDEARRMVASSPSRCESPSRLVGSPKFAAFPGKLSNSALDKRDPLSRSARRHRALEGFSGEILVKSVKHGRNQSLSLDDTPDSPSAPSPASQVQKWFNNILKPSNLTVPPGPTSPNQSNDPPAPSFDPTAPTLPPRQSTHRKSRFQTDPAVASPPTHGIPVPPRRSFAPAPLPENNHLLSPPKNLVESAQRRSISASTCSRPENQQLSPPKNLVESAQRRSISASTCSRQENQQLSPPRNLVEPARRSISKSTCSSLGAEEGQREVNINGFLKEQRTRIDKILNRQIDSKAKVILSGPSNSTSSMIAAICYAWLLEKKNGGKSGGGGGEKYVVVPVVSVRRGKMWNQRQAAWLFHHLGLDVTSMLFADEVDLESLMMSGKLNILVVGQDILRTNGEVGSQCTVLTDNYCEDAYDLLQTPVLKELLLAGILLDTQNLNANAKLAMTKDAEAVQLLLVGSAPNYRNTLYDQLMQDQRDKAFCETLQLNYGKPPSGFDRATQMEQRGTTRKSTSTTHREVITQNSDKNPNDMKNEKTGREIPTSAKPNTLPAPKAVEQVKATPETSRGKNKFSLAKWFGFGSK